MYIKNQCQKVKIISIDKSADMVEIEFIDSDLMLTISKNILQNKVEAGFYTLVGTMSLN